MFSLILLAMTLIIRLSMAWAIGVHWLGDRLLAKYFWLVPIRDLLSFFIWCFSWVGKTVEWRGRQYEVARDGTMVQVEERGIPAPQIDL
jgi:ceramide glucosyltransferase